MRISEIEKPYISPAGQAARAALLGDGGDAAEK